MPEKDPCFVPCDTDVLLNKDVIGERGDRSVPINVDTKKLLKRRIVVSSPV